MAEATPPATFSSFTTPPAFDHRFFGHLLDMIIDSVPFHSPSGLRATCREPCDHTACHSGRAHIWIAATPACPASNATWRYTSRAHNGFVAAGITSTCDDYDASATLGPLPSEIPGFGSDSCGHLETSESHRCHSLND